MSEQVKMMFSIVQRGHGQNLIQRLQSHNVPIHYQCVGQGTAPSEMMDILGLGTSDKDIVISFATKSAAEKLLLQLHSAFPHMGRARGLIHGLILLLSPTAVSKLLSIMVQCPKQELPGGLDMNYESQNSLICISVNLGYTDQVMHTARKAGATGGTVIKARLAGGEVAEEKLGLKVQEEKELILILSPNDNAGNIMTAVNQEYGLRSPAQAIIHALPVDHAFKL